MFARLCWETDKPASSTAVPVWVVQLRAQPNIEKKTRKHKSKYKTSVHSHKISKMTTCLSLLFIFEAVSSHYIALADLEFTEIYLSLSECWN